MRSVPCTVNIKTRFDEPGHSYGYGKGIQSIIYKVRKKRLEYYMTHSDNSDNKELAQTTIKPKRITKISIEEIQEAAHADIMNAVKIALDECENCCLDNLEDKKRLEDTIEHYVKKIIFF